MALDFESPPVYDAVTRDKMSETWQAWHSTSWQTLTSYLSSFGMFLPPLTTAQRDSIQTPVDGQMIYNSTLGKAQLREAGAWKTFVTV